MEALTPVMMVDMVSTVVIPFKKKKKKLFITSLFQILRPSLVTLLPNGTLAGTALRSIQKDTQDSMTIRVAGK